MPDAELATPAPEIAAPSETTSPAPSAVETAEAVPPAPEPVAPPEATVAQPDVTATATETATPAATQGPDATPAPPSDESSATVPQATATSVPDVPPAATATVSPTPSPAAAGVRCSEEVPNCGIDLAACMIIGTEGDDVLTGTPFDDIICGLGGNDRLDGGEGYDVLVGGAGDDHLIGGPGMDCLAPGPGEDVLVDQPNDVVVREKDPEGSRTRLRPDGGCSEVLSESLPNEEAPGVAAGPIGGAVQAAAWFVALQRLAAARRAGDANFPVRLPKRASVIDGVIKQFVSCPTATVSGELVYYTRVNRLRVARQEFTCTTPSEVVDVRLTAEGRARLEDAGELRTAVRVVAGERIGSARVLLELATS